MQGCQYAKKLDQFFEIGTMANFNWHIVNTSYFYVYYTRGDDYR